MIRAKSFRLISRLVRPLLLGVMGVTLLACGGKPDLKETQAVEQMPAPTVEVNTEFSVAWKAASGGSKLGAVQFQPVIKGDTVYTASRSGQIAGFNLTSGERTFSHHIGDDLANGVGANLSNIVAVTEEGEVIAIDRKDGIEKWRYSVERSISAAPALNDQVIAVRTVDGHIIGINAISGEQIWRIERPVASLSLGLDAPGLVAGEGLVNGFSSGRLLASNIYNGSTFWEKRAFRPAGKNEIQRLIDIDATPVLTGQAILVGAFQGGVVSYRLRDGGEVWRNKTAATRKPMAVSGRYLGITGPESDVMLLDVSNGEELWSQARLRGHGLSEPVIVGNSLVVGNMDGDLYFLDLTDGKILSRLQTGSGAVTALIGVDKGVLVYTAGSGRLTLVKPSS